MTCANRALNSHDIYKWHTDQRRAAGRPRASSFAGSTRAPHPAFEHIHEPGGFRRNYVLLRANEQGAAEPPQMLNSFIDFLLLYGHFVRVIWSLAKSHGTHHNVRRQEKTSRKMKTRIRRTMRKVLL